MVIALVQVKGPGKIKNTRSREQEKWDYQCNTNLSVTLVINYSQLKNKITVYISSIGM